MALVDIVLSWLPWPLRNLLLKYSEFLRFAVVGSITLVIDTAVFTTLKLTVLAPKPVTAKVIAVLVATVVSYVLNREWSFNTRGGRERHHEAALFFVVSGLSVIPLWVSRYGLHLHTPTVNRATQEVADFISAQIIGTLVGMAFRWWALRRFVFPHSNAPTPLGDAEQSATPTP
jgi:putative flippase GtrA